MLHACGNEDGLSSSIPDAPSWSPGVNIQEISMMLLARMSLGTAEGEKSLLERGKSQAANGR